jgi:hypothetical protein
MLALLFDVAMGFSAPGISSGLAEWASRVPPASNPEYLVAMGLLDKDTTKQLFVSAAKVGGQLLKQNATVLAGETDVDAFLRSLQKDTHAAFEAVSDGLYARSAAEVGVVASAFDSSVANPDTYGAEISKLVSMYKSEVQAIGSTYASGEFGFTQVENLYLVRNGSYRRLAILTYRPGILGTPLGSRYDFQTWISKEMTPLALNKNKKPQVIDISEVKDVGPDEVAKDPQAPADVANTGS